MSQRSQMMFFVRKHSQAHHNSTAELNSEMLTYEYPYSECLNPAQIYKKVTSGKLPDAFYRIQDTEAKRFIGRCLETVSKRYSVSELLLDPFLSCGDQLRPLPALKLNFGDELGLKPHGPSTPPHSPKRCTDMMITAKMNLEDNTIFSKVQIADKDENSDARIIICLRNFAGFQGFYQRLVELAQPGH